LADPKFALLLVPRAVSQNELRFTARVNLDAEAPNFGVPTPTYGKFFDSSVGESNFAQYRRGHQCNSFGTRGKALTFISKFKVDPVILP
jgi:hypothetical protein